MTTATYTNLKMTADILADVPNVFVVSDAYALRIADLSSVLALCAIYFEDFTQTGCNQAARKFAQKITAASAEATKIAKSLPTPLKNCKNRRNLVQSMLVANMACTSAHKDFMVELQVQIDANTAALETVQAR